MPVEAHVEMFEEDEDTHSEDEEKHIRVVVGFCGENDQRRLARTCHAALVPLVGFSRCNGGAP